MPRRTAAVADATPTELDDAGVVPRLPARLERYAGIADPGRTGPLATRSRRRCRRTSSPTAANGGSGRASARRPATPACACTSTRATSTSSSAGRAASAPPSTAGRPARFASTPTVCTPSSRAQTTRRPARAALLARGQRLLLHLRIDNVEMTTVLVVDDEPIVRDVVVRYLQHEGYQTLEAGDGDTRPRAPRAGASRARRPRPDAAGHRRARALPLDPLPLGSAGDHADRARRGGRQDRRSRARRRRLRDEAVLAAGARRPRQDRAAQNDSRRPHERRDRGRRADDRRRRTRGTQGRRAARADDARVRSALVPRQPTRGRCSRGRS